MIDPVNEADVRVGGRLLDFFDSKSPWNRTLWNSGLCLTLDEVLEAAEAVRSGVLSPAALKFLTNFAQRIAGTDPGAGAEAEKKLLQDALKPKLRLHGLDCEVIELQARRSRAAYLTRWATVLRGVDPPREEQTARAIASHLLDVGFSSDYLHRWWKYRLQHEAGMRPITDILDEAQELSQQPVRSFDVMVPVARGIRLAPSNQPPEWRPPQRVSQWLRNNDFDATGIRQEGGFLFRIDALDPGGVVNRVSEALDQLTARVTVGTKRSLTLLGSVWIKGAGQYHLNRARRGVWVEALERENQLYDHRSVGGIHAAIELLAHLQASSPGAAVAGGWAAIEALLSEPDDRAGAADRLAMLVACSYPRAELTELSYSLLRADCGLGSRLDGIEENRVRCDIIAKAVRSRGIDTNKLPGSDRAAVHRVSRMLRDPRRVLTLVQKHATSSFRRLYRQRNMVLHGARTDAVALRTSLRTAAPLVGAGIDRIVHAHYVDRISPLALVARAKLALATIGTRDGPGITELLVTDVPQC